MRHWPLSLCSTYSDILSARILLHQRFVPLARQHLHDSAAVSRQHTKTRVDRPPRPFPGGTTQFAHKDRSNFRKPAPLVEQRESLTPDRVRNLLDSSLRQWTRSGRTVNRIATMGIDQALVKQMLNSFAGRAPPGGYFPPKEDERWQMDRIVEEAEIGKALAIDKALTQRFMAWVQTVQDIVPEETQKVLAAIQKATDRSTPAEKYPDARCMRRKIIMHVGPTNSGKTYNALRALAAAKTGVYCGPLRLLAHEVFDRLNHGQIVPAGADPNDPPERHVRMCNLITGEERKVVSEGAGLLSCTVEMLNFQVRYQVAVVDEIQMIHDRDRGGHWTAAVLGLNAHEVHLCGEDAVVPLIEALVRETGDELIVNRYERLSPLVCAPKSLKGQLKDVRKGDCVVTFSRAGIFRLKKTIEDKTGKKCAVAYGRLPPEVRSEQAALFNDPDSGFDVLVGSDAIGMGLNLKIKRIIFQTTKKYNGAFEQPLSVSQLKQIAGRAGRYGLAEDDNAAGIATTMHDEDLPALRKALAAVMRPKMTRAVLPVDIDQIAEVQAIIGGPSRLAEVFEILEYMGRTSPLYTLTLSQLQRGDVADFLDTQCEDLSLEEKIIIGMAPLPWRDEPCKEAMSTFVAMYRNEHSVDLRMSLQGSGLLETLDDISALMKKGSPPPFSATTLVSLESLYKILVMYLWCSIRMPLVFGAYTQVAAMSEQTKRAIEYCLTSVGP